MKTSTLVLVSCLTTGCTSITDQCIQEGYRPDAPGAGFSDCIVRKHAEQNARIAIPVTFDENPNEITLIKTGGVYEIPVELNEVLRINLIFDSGATEASIAPDVFLTLLRTGTIGGEDWLPGSYYQIADGSQ